MNVAVAGTLAEMAPHADEWRAQAVAAGSIFVTPEWAEAWFEIYGNDFAPSIRYVTVDGRLVAVLPLMQGANGHLRFVGDGAGDVFAPLVAQDAPVESLEVLLSTLVTHPGKLLILTNVERDARWRQPLRPDRNQVALADRRTVLPYLDLTGLDWPGYLASRSANFRSQLGRKRRALEKAHEVTWRLSENPGDLDRDLEVLFDLHDRRWEQRGSSTASSARMRSFLSSVCSRSLSNGWLRLWTLELDGAPVAAWLGWRVGYRYAYYLAGFDPARGDQSPGLLLLARTIEASIEEGASEYDFLLGNEPYKSRFANAAREVETEILGHRWSMLPVRAEKWARQFGRTLPDPVQSRLQTVVGTVQRSLPLGRYR